LSLYGEYLKERENFEIVESDKGFVSYKIFGEECYIRDLYVLPEYRKSHLASQMADKVAEIAKEHGCKYLTGSVSTKDPKATDNVKVLFSYGFKLLRGTEEMIYFIKRIQ
jgi:ribosomal protein S18 acetylase RimI-like enzyme